MYSELPDILGYATKNRLVSDPLHVSTKQKVA